MAPVAYSILEELGYPSGILLKENQGFSLFGIKGK